MQHLSLETLARLVDEPADGEEALHLEGCGRCRAELEEMRAQTNALGGLGELAPPPAAWHGVAARLRGEGLMSAGPSRAAVWRRFLLRAAAAVAIFLLGSWTGGRAGGGAPASPPPAPTAGTVEEAAARLRRAEAQYLAALARHAELSGESPVGDPLNRLAALEGIVLTTRAALEDAPADPVINGYHLMAVGQREALLREIGRTAGEEWF